MQHYYKHFVGKTIYCNCDDPAISNFFRYFLLNFISLNLKKIITTHFVYSGTSVKYETYKPKITTEFALRSDGKINLNDIIKTNLTTNGDFRNTECIKILKESDIVVTNPPFSLFREYVAQLMEYDKKFIIIGNKNAITYKEIFKLIKENKLWIGSMPMRFDMLFDVPEEYSKELIKIKKEGRGYKFINNVIKARTQAIWFTNLDHNKRYKKMILMKNYIPEDYPKYDNYDAIEESKVVNIPCDYDGAMGGPLDKFNPKQFEILGKTSKGHTGFFKWK